MIQAACGYGLTPWTTYWDDYPKTPERVPNKEDLLEAYAWSITTEERANESDGWMRYSPEQVVAAYRRADEIRRDVAAKRCPLSFA